MIGYRFFCGWAILFGFATLWGQSVTRPGWQPSYVQYDVDQGLPIGIVYSSFQDQDGYMWFCTESGVSRYDSYSFENLGVEDGLADNIIFSGLQDRQGRIWFASYNGRLSYFQHGSFHAVTEPDPNQKSGAIRHLFEDSEGYLWAGTMVSGVKVIGPDGSFLQLPAEQASMTAAFHISEPVPGLVCVFSNEEIFLFRNRKRVGTVAFPLDFAGNAMTKTRFLSLRDGNLALLSQDSLYRLAWDGDRYVHLGTQAIEANATINGFLEDPSGDLWACTDNGVLRIRGKEVTRFFEGYSISYVTVDREGNFWFTTLNGGVLFVPDFATVQLVPGEGEANERILCVERRSRGGVWIGMRNGWLAAVDEDGLVDGIQIGIPGTTHVLPQDVVALQEREDELWIGLTSGLLIRSPGKTKSYRFLASLKAVRLSPRGTILIGTSHLGTQVEARQFPGYDSVEALHISPPYVGLHQRIVRDHAFSNVKTFCVHEDSQGRIWYGTSTGLYVSAHPEKEGQRFRPDLPQLGFRIADIASLPDGRVLVATQGGGLAIIRGQEVSFVTTAQGLSTNNLKCLSTGGPGDVWLGSNSGLDHVQGLEGQNLTVHHFDQSGGLSSNEVNDLVVSGDTLWVATASGLNRLLTSRLEARLDAPAAVAIRSLEVDGKPLALTTDLSLGPDPASLRIRFSSITFRHHGRLEYRYRLKDDASGWATTRNQGIELPYLEPGTYRLEVQARLEGGAWSESGAFLNLKIVPPWYKTWWAWVLLLLLLVLLVWAAFAYRFAMLRVRTQLEIQASEAEQKALRVQINPHFIYNALNSLQHLIADRRRIEALNYVATFSRLMQRTFRQSETLSISLAEEMENLEMYLKIEALRFPDKFDYRLSTGPNLDPEMVRLPGMLLQPLVENAIWHGLMPLEGKGEVHIRFYSEPHGLRILIEDNGVGLEAGDAPSMEDLPGGTRLSGLRVTRERLQVLSRRLGKDFSLHIRPLDAAGGTVVELHIPEI